MDVGDWLRSLGLDQYEALFRENDIDAEVLSDLTDGDLEKFGCHSAIAISCAKRNARRGRRRRPPRIALWD